MTIQLAYIGSINFNENVYGLCNQENKTQAVLIKEKVFSSKFNLVFSIVSIPVSVLVSMISSKLN